MYVYTSDAIITLRCVGRTYIYVVFYKGGHRGSGSHRLSKGMTSCGWDRGLLGRAVCVICLPLLR